MLTVSDLSTFCADVMADIRDLGYHRVSASFIVIDTGRIQFSAYGYTAEDHHASDIVSFFQGGEPETFELDTKRFFNTFKDLDEVRKEKANVRLLNLIDEIKSLGIDIDINPLTEISKKLASNAITLIKEDNEDA